MTLEYLLPTVREMNPQMDEIDRSVYNFQANLCGNTSKVSDARNLSDDYRKILDYECNKKCYDNEVRLSTGVVAA